MDWKRVWPRKGIILKRKGGAWNGIVCASGTANRCRVKILPGHLNGRKEKTPLKKFTSTEKRKTSW